MILMLVWVVLLFKYLKLIKLHFSSDKQLLHIVFSAVLCTLFLSLSSRLNKLLYKHKFEEAEKFAKAFGLDVEVRHW